MTKRSITKSFVGAIAIFTILIAAGITISVFDTTEKRLVFTTFKDLVPLGIAIVAAWLGFCVQRRSAYLQQLRTLWSKLIDAVQSATQYTHLPNPTQDDYSMALLKLSIVIDEIRGLFCNLDDHKGDGLYPFEPFKTIFERIGELGFGDNFDPAHAKSVRKEIFKLWKNGRKELLKEFDREVPTWPSTHWKT